MYITTVHAELFAHRWTQRKDPFLENKLKDLKSEAHLRSVVEAAAVNESLKNILFQIRSVCSVSYRY